MANWFRRVGEIGSDPLGRDLWAPPRGRISDQFADAGLGFAKAMGGVFGAGATLSGAGYQVLRSAKALAPTARYVAPISKISAGAVKLGAGGVVLGAIGVGLGLGMYGIARGAGFVANRNRDDGGGLQPSALSGSPAVKSMVGEALTTSGKVAAAAGLAAIVGGATVAAFARNYKVGHAAARFAFKGSMGLAAAAGMGVAGGKLKAAAEREVYTRKDGTPGAQLTKRQRDAYLGRRKS